MGERSRERLHGRKDEVGENEPGPRESLTFRAGVWLLVGANRGAGEGFRQDASGQLEAGKEGFYLVDRLQLFDKFLILIK